MFNGPTMRQPDGYGAAASATRSEAKKPVVIVLHQEQSNSGHIGQWFARNGHALDIRRPRYGDPLPATLEHHCGAVIFGGPMSANDPDDYIGRETDWIGVALKEKKPFFGVCLGAQMLARHLGARVYLHPDNEVEIGYFALSPTGAGDKLGPWPGHVYEWHKEGFDVPAGGEVIARSSGAFPNQAFAYGPAALGVQFHPEITYAQVCRWTGHNPALLEQRGASPRDAQMAAHLDHAPPVHAWLDRFLSQWVMGCLVR